DWLEPQQYRRNVGDIQCGRKGVPDPGRAVDLRGHEIEARDRAPGLGCMLSGRHGGSLAPAIGRFGGICKALALRRGKDATAVNSRGDGRLRNGRADKPVNERGEPKPYSSHFCRTASTRAGDSYWKVVR